MCTFICNVNLTNALSNIKKKVVKNYISEANGFAKHFSPAETKSIKYIIDVTVNV